MRRRLDAKSVCLGLVLGICGAAAVGAQRTGGAKNAVAPAVAAAGYKIVSEADAQQVEAAVQRMAAEGWQPVGGVAYAPPTENGAAANSTCRR